MQRVYVLFSLCLSHFIPLQTFLELDEPRVFKSLNLGNLGNGSSSTSNDWSSFSFLETNHLMITDMTKICNELMPYLIYHSMYLTNYGIDNIHRRLSVSLTKGMRSQIMPIQKAKVRSRSSHKPRCMMEDIPLPRTKLLLIV